MSKVDFGLAGNAEICWQICQNSRWFKSGKVFEIVPRFGTYIFLSASIALLAF